MIPKIIHQVWLGPHDPPQECLDSWRLMNPDWEYRLHRQHTGYPEELQTVLDAIFRADRRLLQQWRAMADVIRWWVLWKYGGVAVDADSECVRPLDKWLTEIPEWAAWENEQIAPGIIANGTVGAEPGSLLMSRLVQRLPMRDPKGAPWLEYGPHYLTEEAYGYRGLRVLPSRHFIPWHAGLSHPYGIAAPGDARVYARQFWGSRNGYRGLDVSDRRFVVLSTGVNIPQFAPCCLGSMASQKFACRHIVYTDPDTAKIVRDVSRQYERGCLVDLRSDKGFALANIWEAVNALDPETIVICLDLDDMLLPGALEAVRDVYDSDPNVRITWGQFRYWPAGGSGFSEALPSGVVNNRTYRAHKWVTSHLRTFKAGLFQELDVRELQNRCDLWLEYAGDCAMMWSMLERTHGHEQKFISKELYAYNRRFVDSITAEQLEATKRCEAEVRAKPRAPAPPTREPKAKKVRLNIGCGKLARPGWVNVDRVDLPGVDVIRDLEHCGFRKMLPFDDSSVDEIYGAHVLEHITNLLPLMAELWRVAKPGTKATFVVPHSDSDLAKADPTHVRLFVEETWSYFGQPKYDFSDYSYPGDWEVISVTVDDPLMVAELRAVKPARRPRVA